MKKKIATTRIQLAVNSLWTQISPAA